MIIGWLVEIFLTILTPVIISKLTDDGLVKGNFKVLCGWLSVFSVVSLIAYTNELMQTKVSAKISNHFSMNLHYEMLKKLLKVSFSKMQTRNPTEVFTTMNMDIERIMLLFNAGSFKTIL